MLLTMSVLAEGLQGFPFSLGGQIELERTISSVCPLTPKTNDETLWVTDHASAPGCTLPHHAAVAFPEETSQAVLDQVAADLSAGGSCVLCVAIGTPSELVAALQKVFRRYEAWDERLVSAIISGANAEKVLELGAEGLANPIALFDSSSALVAHAGALPKGWERSVWGDVVKHGFVPMERYTREERQSYRAAVLSSERPVIIQPKKGQGEHELTCRIEVAGTLFAMIAQVDLIAPFSPGQQALVMHLRDRIQEMSQSRASSIRHTDELGHLLRLILEGSAPTSSVVRFHLQRRGWQEGHSLWMTVIPVDEGAGLSGETLLGRLRITFPKALSILHEGHAVMVLRKADYGIEAVESTIAGMLAGLDASAAASDAFDSLSQARKAYRQCLLAGDLEGKGPREGFVRFAGVAQDVLVNALERQHVDEALTDRRVLRLAEEVANPGETVSTLRTYLLCGCNAARTARQTFMHRNTLDYRIALMEKTLGCKLAELAEDEAARMILSCTIVLSHL